VEDILEDVLLQDQEGDGRIMVLRWLLRRLVSEECNNGSGSFLGSDSTARDFIS
jgi:hypothetical protein